MKQSQTAKPTNTKSKSKGAATNKRTTSVASSDVDAADSIDENTISSVTRRLSSAEASSTSKSIEEKDTGSDPDSDTDGRSPRKPSIVGIVGARRVGVKWRMMIRNENPAVINDGVEKGEKEVKTVNKTFKDKVSAVLVSSGASVLTQAPSRRVKEVAVEEEVDQKSGMRQFGINKGGISRAIVKFSGPPAPHPLTICFHFPGTFLTHNYVLDMVRTKLQILEANDNAENVVGKVSTIEFIDRNTIHGTQGMDNRWLVTLANLDCVDLLIEQGLHLFNRKISVKHYDEILSEEYAEFLEYRNLTNKLYAKNDEEASGAEINTAVAKNELTDCDNENETAINQTPDLQPTALEALCEEENENY